MDLGQLGERPRGCFQILIIQSDMEPHQQIKWAGNGDGSNVRLGVRWTPDSLENAQGVLSNLNYTIQYGASSTNQMGWEWVRK